MTNPTLSHVEYSLVSDMCIVVPNLKFLIKHTTLILSVSHIFIMHISLVYGSWKYLALCIKLQSALILLNESLYQMNFMSKQRKVYISKLARQQLFHISIKHMRSQLPVTQSTSYAQFKNT